MKEKRVRYLSVSLLLALAVLSATSATAQESTGTVIAMVTKINGLLEYRTEIGGEWQEADVRQELYNGYQVRTTIGNRSMLIYVSSGTRVLVNENTELTIEANVPQGTAQKPTLERTRLMIGEIVSRIPGEGNEYEVETPSSVASVRGTEFYSNFGNGQAQFLSIENIVEIANQFGSVLLNPNQMTTVQTGQAPQDPQTVSQNQANRMTGWTDDVEPTWRLNLQPEGGTEQAIGEAFDMTVWVTTPDGNVDSDASFALDSFTADADNVEFSTDGGRTWTAEPQVTLVNGQAVVRVRSAETGAATITARAEFCEPASASVTFAEPKERQTIEATFTDPDGSDEQTIIIEMEEK